MKFEKEIRYCGSIITVACDGNCKKAWGLSSRPKESLSIDNPDDVVWLADGELGEAPADPGTYEGGDGKPASNAEFPNKWCVRACERCSKPGVFGEIRPENDFSKRVYNILSKNEAANKEVTNEK